MSAIVGTIVFVCVATFAWYGLHSGWTGSNRVVELCDGRAGKTFDRFWQRVGGRELAGNEGYTILATHNRQPKPVIVALSSCRKAEADEFDCRVVLAKPELGLSPGDEYKFNRQALVNWSYRRGRKRHQGCNTLAIVSLPFAKAACEKAAREKLHELRWVVSTPDVGPKDHWVDVKLTSFGMRVEMRLNRCKSLPDGTMTCRIDSAPPELDFEADDVHVVRPDDVVAWSYKSGHHKYRSCDGVDLKADKELDRAWSKALGRLLKRE